MRRFVAIVFLSSLSAFAQTNRGGIAGTVTDSSGSVVPNATVTITNIGTNEVRPAKTTEIGTYSVSNLEPVVYEVKVEAPGFKTEVVRDVKVDTSQTASVNISLSAGAVDTKITVEADATVIDTQSGALSNTVTERQIQDVPLLNRSVLDLALTLPNVSGDAGTEDPALVGVTTCPGCNLSLGGGRPMSSLILADGANNTGVSLGRTIVSFTPETVQEFTVQTSAFSAEYGNTGGGIINATTKSGTNQLTGTALWYNRNPDLAAAPFTLATTNRSQPTLKYNQFSLAAGGPVYIPKLYHLDQYGLMPTDAMRNGDFSGLVNSTSGWLPQSVVNQFKNIAPNGVLPAGGGDNLIYNQYNVINGNQFQQAVLPAGVTSYTPFPNNVIPQSMLDKTALKAEAYIAQAGPYYVNGNAGISNIYSPRLLSQDEKRYTVKIDHTISNNNRISGRYTTTPIVKLQGTPVSPTNTGSAYSWGTQALLSDTHTFSPTVINELRLNYTRGRFSSTVAPQWDVATGANLNTEFGLPTITKGGLPTFSGLVPGSSPGNGASTATGFGGAGSTNAEDKEERYAITDIVYKQRGTMSLKFGVDVGHALQNIIPLYGAFGGVYPFAATQTNSNAAASGTGGATWASFLLGIPSGNVTLRNVEVPYYYRYNNGAGFIQDDWKVRPNLTLNLGLRYNLEMPRTEKYNNQGVFRPDLAQTVQLPAPLKLADGTTVTSTQIIPFAFAGIGGNSRYLTPPQYRDFEPRFGFAWQPKFLASHNVVVRGGWGMSHAPVSGFTQLPQPDFGATSAFSPGGVNTTTGVITASSTAFPNYIMRLGENPPVLTPTNPAGQVFGPAGPPSNGLSFANSLYYQQAFGGFAVSQNYHTPYVNNWNLTTSWQANRSTTVDLGYSGAMGIHLFMGQENINPKDSSVLSAELAQNISTTTTINDPLGRLNPFTGKVLTIQPGTLGSPFLGYSSLYLWYDSSGNSIRHAGYVNVTHRVATGLTFTGNYTYAKSIDTASSAGGDKGILTAVNGQVGGQVAFGGTRANDRSVSTFDQRHVIHGNAIYDLPFGRGRKFGSSMWRPLDYVAGGWTVSGLSRISSGFPYVTYLSDTNQLGDLTHTARPDINPNVPLINPLYNRICPTGTGCQPYLNPAAFERPALGVLGNAPRTLDGARGPWQPFLDLSLQKTFKLTESGRFRAQLRVDALNAFNHPVFAVYPNSGGGADFMGAPNAGTLTTAAYNTWAAYNNQPVYSATAGTPGNVLYNNIVNMINSQRTGGVTGALPANFFTVPLDPNFWAKNVNAFDITTLNGYKQYQLKSAYGTNFGTLYNSSTPRYVQLGLKIYF
jgi:Carboxypeptidase regulatory-like domain